jgi:predicted MPP superfamily phosphohydrolase
MLWISDIHGDKKTEKELLALIDSLDSSRASSICITGDIAEGNHIDWFLERLYQKVKKPILFVLGNHDYHHTGINKRYLDFSKRYTSGIVYVPSIDVIELDEGVGLIGIDNWYNLSDHPCHRMQERLQDFDFIEELNPLGKDELVTFFEKASEKSIEELDRKLTLGCKKHKKLYVLMHVPPFHPHYFYGEEISDNPWAFCFSCDPIGRFLIEFMQKHSDHAITVLSGHTHIQGSYQPLINLEALVASPCSERYFVDFPPLLS